MSATVNPWSKSSLRLKLRISDAYATYLSGAGPTIMNLLAPEHTAAFVAALEKLGLEGQIFQLKIDTFGVRVEK